MNELDSLIKLNELLEKGTITQSEFDKLKAEILNQGTKNSGSAFTGISKSNSRVNNKLLYIIVGISTILIATFYYFFILSNSIVLVPYLKSNGKYVYVDSASMKTEISKEFDRARLFSEGLAAICINDKWGFIDNKGSIIIEAKFKEVLRDFNNSVALVNENYELIKIDKDGKKIESVGLDLGEGLSKIEVDGKKKIIDNSGKIVVDSKYSDCQSFSEELAKVSDEQGWWGFIDKSGREIIPINFSREHGYHYASDFSEGLAVIATYLNGKFGFIDKSGKLLINLKYDGAYPFKEGLAAIMLGNKWGFIDKKDNLVIPCIYDRLNGFSDGVAAVCLNEKWGFIDKNGNQLIEPRYWQVRDFKDGIAQVALNTDGIRNGFIDKTGDEVIPIKYREISQASSSFYYAELDDTTRHVISSTGVEGYEYKKCYIDQSGREYREN